MVPEEADSGNELVGDEVIHDISQRLRKLRKEGCPEKMILLYGRDRTNGFLERFTNAFGTSTKLGQRGLCSLNKRMAIRSVIGDTGHESQSHHGLLLIIY